MLFSSTPEKKQAIQRLSALVKVSLHDLDYALTHGTLLTHYDTEKNAMAKAWTKMHS